MKIFKKSCLAVLMTAMTSSAMAGGLMTNTNQSVAFLRQLSQNATIDIASLYTNPAGTAFLSDGWHLALNVQTAIQDRNIETTFPLFAGNLNDHSTTHKFNGEAFAPVIPSFQVSYNKDKWSVNANFALSGGGGKCEFKKGLGSFEALYAGTIYTNVATNVAQQLAQGFAQTAIPQYMAGGMTLEQATAAVAGPAAQYAQDHLAETMAATYGGYSLDAYMKGRQYYFGLTLGATYKFMENLSGYLGLRGVYATCNYNGFVQDVKYSVAGNLVDANSDLSLNCDQTGFGVTPIIGIDWKINDQWNIAAKYEMNTHMMLKNDSQMNDMAKAQASQEGNVLSQFADGKKVEEDIPGIFAMGVQYSPVEALRLNAGFNVYFDKNAEKFADKQKLINDNTHEVTAGVEYDINKYITVSASWQNTKYGLSDEYMNDLSFNLSSNSVALGARINATKRCSIDLGYMHTFYKDRTVETQTAAGIKSDLYSRSNNVLGAAVVLAF